MRVRNFWCFVLLLPFTVVFYQNCSPLSSANQNEANQPSSIVDEPGAGGAPVQDCTETVQSAPATDPTDYLIDPNGRLFHVDPVNGSDNGDGSAASPWRDLQTVINTKVHKFSYKGGNWQNNLDDLNESNPNGPVEGGDTILLYDGFHGEIDVTNSVNKQMIRIVGKNGEKAKVTSVLVRSSKNWEFKNIEISPSFDSNISSRILFKVENHSWTGPASFVNLVDSNMFSVTDATTSTFTSNQDWSNHIVSGISSTGSDVKFINNKMRNVGFAVTIQGDNSIVSRNEITNFTGDGIRALSNDSIIEYNTVRNSLVADANHDDFLQSFTNLTDNGMLENVVVRGNKFIEGDPNHPFYAPAQGIGMFDGFFKNWTIENNVVIVDHWHGISLYGAIDCKVVNNTVFDPSPTTTPGPAWIMITDHKNKSPSTGNLMANNLAVRFNLGEFRETDGNQFVGNRQLASDELDSYFVDVNNNNYNLKMNSPAIDAVTSIHEGNSIYTPSNDASGAVREGLLDIGAIEYENDYNTVSIQEKVCQ